MHLSIENVKLTAVTGALPSTMLNMADLANVFGSDDVKRIRLSTGIHSVRLGGSLSTADLCEAAARRVIEAAGIEAQSIDGLVLVTQTPDDLMPGSAFEVHKRLNLSRDCVVFDVNHGCSGYIYGLLQAAGLIAAGCHRVLLCTGDVISNVLDPEDRKVRMVFGDGGSASIVERGDSPFDFAFWSDGNGNVSLKTAATYKEAGDRIGHLYMDGNEVMRFALTHVPPVIEGILRRTNTRRDAISLYGLHQANQFMISYLRKLMHLQESVVPTFLENIGNTGPSSIPLLLSARANEMALSQGPALLCGFGVGLSIGAVLLDLSRTKFITPVDVAGK